MENCKICGCERGLHDKDSEFTFPNTTLVTRSCLDAEGKCFSVSVQTYVNLTAIPKPLRQLVIDLLGVES